MYLDSYPCVNYCDSIIFTDLVVNNVFFSQNSISICNGDSIFIGGKYHSLPGTYYDSLLSINGCDSITVIQLSVNNEIIVQIDTMICYGDSVYAGGQYQTSVGLYVDSLLSVYSCDSIVYTNIDFYPLPVIDLGNDTTINIGDSLVLDAGPGCVSWLWSDGSTNQSLIINSPGIYWVQGIGICGDVIYDTIIVDVGYSINGTLSYANPAMTAMNNTAIYLKCLPDVIVDSTLTGSAGAYSFGPLANGTYYLESGITKPWGGANSTDALAIMKHFVGLQYLNGLYLKAADVNTNTGVNSADALMVQLRYIGIINTYTAGDWLWEDNNITVYGLNVIHDLQALCYGDVNGSFIPSQAKKPPEIVLIPQMEKPIESFQEFDLPFMVEMPLEAGAISLAMEYPSQYLKIEDVKLGNGERDNLVYADKNGEIRISWYSIEPLILKTNDTLLLIKFRVGDLTGDDNNKLNFTVKSSSELADANATVLNDINLYIPELIINRPPAEYFLGQNFPNPFKNETEIEYGLKNAGNVNLRVYDILGQEVLILVDKYQEAGYYKVKLNKNKLPEGIYIYKITITGSNCSFTKSQTFVISK